MRISTLGAFALSGTISVALLAGCSGLGQQGTSVPNSTSLQSVVRQQSVTSAIPRELMGVHPPQALLIGHGITPDKVKPYRVYASTFAGASIPDYPVPNPGNRAAKCSESGSSFPNGIGVDNTSVLYVPQGSLRELQTYAPNCGALLTTVAIPAGTDNQPTDVALDETNKIAWVDTLEDGIYPVAFGGSSVGTPLTCTSYLESFTDAVDSKGDVFVGGRTSSGSSVVYEWAGGTGSCVQVGVTGFGTIGGLTFDAKDNLIDVDFTAGILVWAPPYSGNPTSVTAEKGESIYGRTDKLGDTLYVSDFANGSVDVFKYKSSGSTYAYSWTNGLVASQDVEGIGVDPPVK